MAYNERVKNFNRIRDYMREFYVYGFKSRDEFTKKSARSYDDEKRRLESWLGDYMQFRQTADGKNVFLSIDSRLSRHNPLYKAWKTKSFTDGDITLHFIIFDILYDPEKKFSITEIMKAIDTYLSEFQVPRMFDESTVRKKLKEYVNEGLIVSEKTGRTVYYRKSKMEKNPEACMLDFYSEVAPCGVIGSFLLDKLTNDPECFAFKHHYITSAMDSEIICRLFRAIREKRGLTIETINRKKNTVSDHDVIPLKIFISVQNGRQYLMAYAPEDKRISSYRTDNIISVKYGETVGEFNELREKLNHMQQFMWGVRTQSRSGNRLEHVEFTIQYDEGETHIPQRLEREKRCGKVEHFDKHTSRFYADVYDSSELIPWIRTFICRITEIHFSNEAIDRQFKKDVQVMYEMYGVGGSENV